MRFCEPMKRHFMTTAASNAATALSMAKELWASDVNSKTGVQELVQIIDFSSRRLIDVCQSHAYQKVTPTSQPNPQEQDDSTSAAKP